MSCGRCVSQSQWEAPIQSSLQGIRVVPLRQILDTALLCFALHRGSLSQHIGRYRTVSYLYSYHVSPIQTIITFIMHEVNA